MKSIFKEKFLQYVITKKPNAGFTVLELLVVIIIIGILAAIVLPSFLSCRVTAITAPAKEIMSLTKRSQQEYYLNHKKFADTLEQLKINITPIQAKNHNYIMKIEGNMVYIYATLKDKTLAEKNNAKSLAGIIFIKNKVAEGLICQSTNFKDQPIPAPIIIKGNLVCAPNTLEMN